MPEKHYENFPVASVMLPEPLRKPVGLIYTFARQADDFADEGELSDETRIGLLEAFRFQLGMIANGTEPDAVLFRELGRVIEQFELPISCFTDLLDAFTQDVYKKRYENFDEILEYCGKSANPVGRLLLHLYDADSPRNREFSDRICSSLQLINFLQDIQIDFGMGRIYLAADEMLRYGIKESDIASECAGESWAKFMLFQVERAKTMMLEGVPLASELKGRIALEMKLIILGGLRILEKIEHAQGDIFRRRPKLGRLDWMLILLRVIKT